MKKKNLETDSLLALELKSDNIIMMNQINSLFIFRNSVGFSCDPFNNNRTPFFLPLKLPENLMSSVIGIFRKYAF